MRIAFDIDDTILVPSVAMGNGISGDNVPNYEVIAVLRWFQAQGHEIILWSGSGMDWARRWGEKFGLEPFTVMKKELPLPPNVDIAFDDCDVNLAKVNVKVKRINNSVSRKDWNERKPAADEVRFSEEQVKRMVDRFLQWRLPEDFNPDCGIRFDADSAKKLNPRNQRYEPIGTNLLSATQANAMVRYMIDGL